MRSICRFILTKLGWQIKGDTNYPEKCILCVAPHTSNWDFLLGKVAYVSMGRQACFLIKKSWFFFPFNILFNAMGGIPVDRNKKTSRTSQLAEEFSKRKHFQLAVTPEGTRKKNDEWKKGFYYIAVEAKVPIVIVAFNYKEKAIEFKAVFYPTGDIEQDLPIIKNYYKGVEGKHPNKFSTGI